MLDKESLYSSSTCLQMFFLMFGQAEYKKLADQLSAFTVKLLGHVRSSTELDIILRESTHQDDRDRLARLKLAIRYGEKLVI